MPGPGRLCWIAVVASGVWGCGNGSSESTALIDAAKWSVVDEADDPFIDQRPADAVCDPLGYETEEFEEEPAFFVDTRACNYLTVEQAAQRSADAGATLHLRLYHYDLVASEPAQAHLALAIHDQTVWESNVDIPADAELIDTTWQAEHAIDEGDPILFHVDNHGDNNYALIELSVME